MDNSHAPVIERTPDDRAGLHVLVVEDHADTAEALDILLRLHGYQVQVASDGPRALQAAKANPPDVVLLDLGLPGMDGWEVARRLREPHGGKAPLLVAVTAYGSLTDRRRSQEVGIHMHLTKPVDSDQLLIVLKGMQKLIGP